VLLVDDQRGVLDRVSAMLVPEFDVVGCETDGRQALQTAARVRPDVIVLDIDLPGLNGFETMRALGHAGGHAAVVFLSTFGQDDYVAEAFRRGASGYVRKSHVASDLHAALDLALRGRRFVPSLTAWLEVAGAGGHALHLHRSESSFVGDLVALLDRSLGRGDATCIIGPRRFRDAVRAGLGTRGRDLDGSHGRFRAHDSAAALESVMREGFPDPSRLAELVSELDRYRREAASGSNAMLTIGGTLSGVLAEGGNVEGAVVLERLWNELTVGLPFVTVCGYLASCFPAHDPDAWSGVSGEHSTVGHATEP